MMLSFQIQAADNATVSSEPTKGQEGAQPTEYLGRDRVAFTGARRYSQRCQDDLHSYGVIWKSKSI